jgi:hypothetical protein
VLGSTQLGAWLHFLKSLRVSAFPDSGLCFPRLPLRAVRTVSVLCASAVCRRINRTGESKDQWQKSKVSYLLGLYPLVLVMILLAAIWMVDRSFQWIKAEQSRCEEKSKICDDEYVCVCTSYSHSNPQ